MDKKTTNKRTLDGFLQPSSRKKVHLIDEPSDSPASNHPTYPFPIPYFPSFIEESLPELPASEAKEINNQPHLDLLYFQPYIPKSVERHLFEFLREKLFFYRVQYNIKRGSIDTQINTPRYTTVFGVDETSRFVPNGSLVDTQTSKLIPLDRYRTYKPRPIPHCLDELRKITEVFTSAKYNFCLVNYYASGDDSISYHSDDERFLGSSPSIASFSLGAKRDFLMKHKPIAASAMNPSPASANDKPLKLALASGDMVLMRGTTQANWLHSVPKRKGGESERGRINITFRKAMERGGTENYYQYNVGSGQVWKWDGSKGEMRHWATNA